MQIRLPHINAFVFRQFILYAYTGKVRAVFDFVNLNRILYTHLHEATRSVGLIFNEILIGSLQITFHDARVFELMTLAQDLGIDELKSACEDYVISTLSVTNACTYLAAAMEIQEKSSCELNGFYFSFALVWFSIK